MNVPTIPKDIVQKRLNDSLRESLDFIKRVDYSMLEDYGYCLSFLRQILQQKFDMDLEKVEELDEYSGQSRPAQD